jgi:hypothetical protein
MGQRLITILDEKSVLKKIRTTHETHDELIKGLHEADYITNFLFLHLIFITQIMVKIG